MKDFMNKIEELSKTMNFVKDFKAREINHFVLFEDELSLILSISEFVNEGERVEIESKIFESSCGLSRFIFSSKVEELSSNMKENDFCYVGPIGKKALIENKKYIFKNVREIPNTELFFESRKYGLQNSMVFINGKFSNAREFFHELKD